MKWRLVLSGLYMGAVTMAYLVMLAIMSFNVGVFVTVILSLTFCHVVFSYIKLL